MLYTSGTTGRPKGVRLTHAALAATVTSLEEAWRWRARRSAAARAAAAPHARADRRAAGRAVGGRGDALHAVRGRARLGARSASATRVHGGADDLREADARRHAAAAPEQRARAGRRRRAACGCFTSGSAALPAALLEAFRDATGQTILERYGMTEIGMALSNPYDGPRVPGAVGRELPGVEVDIVDDDGRADAPPASRASCACARRRCSPRYHGDAAATAASFDDEGRFRTGDTGARDADGVVRLLGRTSIDIIKSGGYKLSALEIEAALLRPPGGRRGRRDRRARRDLGRARDRVGRRARRRAADAGRAAGVRARAAGALQAAARAASWLPELPRNAMGKVQKQRLRAR